ncbi:MAG: methyltransferase, partial [Rhabdaerophilum sp.]
PPGAFLLATAAAAAELAGLAGGVLEGTKHVAELFCGLGPFGLRLARKMKVTAFDSDRSAIEAFQRSIRANPGGKPASAEARDLFRRPLFAPELKPFDAVLLDPPRQGAEAQIREIAKSRIGRVAYVSCDTESFARDAQVLVAAGFRLDSITPVDQFRHSPHVELVAGFTR